jgi:hypothetical protein
MQNFYGTLIVDTIGIGVDAAGLLNPLLAAFIHVASELTLILSSTRRLPPREQAAVSNPLNALPLCSPPLKQSGKCRPIQLSPTDLLGQLDGKGMAPTHLREFLHVYAKIGKIIFANQSIELA